MQISFGGGVGWDGHTMLTLYGRDRDNMDPTLAHQRKLSILVLNPILSTCVLDAISQQNKTIELWWPYSDENGKTKVTFRCHIQFI